MIFKSCDISWIPRGKTYFCSIEAKMLLHFTISQIWHISNSWECHEWRCSFRWEVAVRYRRPDCRVWVLGHNLGRFLLTREMCNWKVVSFCIVTISLSFHRFLAINEITVHVFWFNMQFVVGLHAFYVQSKQYLADAYVVNCNHLSFVRVLPECTKSLVTERNI